MLCQRLPTPSFPHTARGTRSRQTCATRPLGRAGGAPPSGRGHPTVPQRAARFIVLVPVHEQLLDVLIATFIDVLGVQRAIVGIDDLLLGVHDALEHGLRPGGAGSMRGGDGRRVLAQAARRVRAWRMRAAPCASAEHREAGGATASGRPPPSRTAPAAPVTAPRARCGAVFE